MPEFECGWGLLGQQLEELLEARQIELEVGRKLKQDDAQPLTQDAGRA